MKTVAILTSHNRRAQTIRCLEAFLQQEVDSEMELRAVLLDDASRDGTAAAVRERFVAVHVLEGTGELYWAGGMAVAEREARKANPDYLLWLNDDVVLERTALQLLIATANRARPAIAVGAVRDPASGKVSYSGLRRRDHHPLRFELVEPADEPLPVDTFNGNVVVVPRRAAAAVGLIDGRFGHGAADLDYGLRARAAGVATLLAPGSVGICPKNVSPPPWADASASLLERMSGLVGPKGVPPRARARFLRRHGGFLWPLYWAAPYARAVPSLLNPRRSAPST